MPTTRVAVHDETKSQMTTVLLEHAEPTVEGRINMTVQQAMNAAQLLQTAAMTVKHAIPPPDSVLERMRKTMEADVITTPATITGPHGRAWDIDFSRIVIDPAKEVGVAQFMVEAAWAHPVWHSYVVSLIELRDVADAPPMVIRLPNATHEFCMWALDPGQPRQKMIDDLMFARLNPPNFAAQFIAGSNAEAKEIIRETVVDILHGRISPDTDFRKMWIARFNDSMVVA